MTATTLKALTFQRGKLPAEAFTVPSGTVLPIIREYRDWVIVRLSELVTLAVPREACRVGA
jgi:hypothetical protein